MNTLMKVACMVAILGSLALAQTTGVTPTQMTGKPSTSGMIYAVMPDGSVKMVKLGAGLSLVADTADAGAMNLVVTVPTVVLPRYTSEVLTAGGTTRREFTLTAAPKDGTLKVFQNGLRQAPGVDYTLTGQTITFVAYYGDMSTAKVVVDYEQ